jgi:hypothetical protein
MSYSNLIQKDNPAIVWSLDDSDTTVRPDKFLYKTYTDSNTRTYYSGEYSNIVKTGLPLIYGGKQSIKITNNSGYIKVPSLDKMSLKDSRNSSSLEFWVKLSSSSNQMSTLMYKKDVNESASDDYATSIYIKNDYIVFRLGVATKYYEVSTPIDTTNKPLHIVATYSPESITLIVNGISRTKSITSPDSLFPAYDPDDEYFYFAKPSGISLVEYDCISLYSYQIRREKCIKHFVYGTGYSIPSEIINSNGGVFYNFSMDGHKEINKYDMGPGSSWSITDANNCLIENGLLTIKKKQEPKTYFADGVSVLDTSLFTASNTYNFVSGSYLEVENINSIIPDSLGGWAAKFDEGSYGSTKKVLMSIGSKLSQNYIEFYIITESSTNKINVDVSGEITTLKTGHDLSTEFYIGYYKDISKTSNVFFLTSSSQVIVPITLPEIPSAYARFGSDNIWFEGEDISKLEDPSGLSDSKLLKIVGIHKDNSSLYDTYSKIEGSSFKHYYTSTPNTLERRFKVKSYAKAIIDIDQQLLCAPLSEITGACRIEIGNPSKSESVSMSLDEKAYSGGIEQSSINIYNMDTVSRVINSGSWLNKKITQTENSTTNPVDSLSFTFDLNTDDLTDQPPYLNYFRIASYALDNDGEDYVLNSSSPGGNPAKIYLKEGECNIPDLIEMPFFYNGHSSGLKIKKSYAKINHNFTSVQKFAQIVNIVVDSGNATYTLSDNPFVAGEIVSVSEINGSNQFSFANKAISSVSGNNIIFTGFSPTGTYTPESSESDGTAGVMQLASGISTVSFMLYVDSESIPSTPLNVLKVASNQFSAFTSLTSASYNSDTSATFTYNSNVQIFAIGDVVDITGVTGGSYNKSVTVTGIGGTSGAYTFTATGTNFTNFAGTGGNYLINSIAYINGVKYNQSSNPVKINEWQMITLVYNNPFYIYQNVGVEIILGDPTVSLPTNVYIDQLMIFDKKLTTDNGLGSLDNLYNTFVGNIDGLSNVPEAEIKIYDENEVKIEKFEVVFCQYLISSGAIYNELIGGQETETLTIQYKKSTGKSTITKKTSEKVSNSKTVPLKDTKNLEVGYKRLNNSNVEISSINSLDSGATRAKTTDGKVVVSTKQTEKHTRTIKLSNVSDIQNKDFVILKDYITAGAYVTSINSSTKVVTITFPKPASGKKCGIIKEIKSLSKIEFKEPKPKVVLSVASTIGKGSNVVFKDKAFAENNTEKQKLILSSGKIIRSGEKILVLNSSSNKYFLYTVESVNGADKIPQSINKNFDVTFTKETLLTSELYRVDGKYYRFLDNKLEEISFPETTRSGRVAFKFQPQYEITEQ